MAIHALHEVEIWMKGAPDELLGTVRLPRQFTGDEITFGSQSFNLVEDRIGAGRNTIFVVPSPA